MNSSGRCRRSRSRRIRSRESPSRAPRHEGQQRPQRRRASVHSTITHWPSAGSPSRPSAIEKPRSVVAVAPVRRRRAANSAQLVGRDVRVAADRGPCTRPARPGCTAWRTVRMARPSRVNSSVSTIGLVAELQGVQAVPGVDRAGLLARAHHGRAPSRARGLGQPRLDGAGPGLGVADRVAGGERDAADDAVGDGRPCRWGTRRRTCRGAARSSRASPARRAWRAGRAAAPRPPR